ncbi:hypothetical protein Tco_0384877 [Tanacetum coccineum]
MNTSVTIPYRFKITLQLCFFDGSKPVFEKNIGASSTKFPKTIDEIVLAHVRTSALEILIEDIQIRHRSDMKNLLNKIHKLKNHKGGPPPPDY